MRLLSRPPETLSLEIWLSRDVPYERALANELLNDMGRENALAALLALHNREAQRLAKRRRPLLQMQVVLTVAATLLLFASWQWPRWFYTPFVIGFSSVSLITAVALITVVGLQEHNVRLKNYVAALLKYDDSPLVCEPLCCAIAYYAFYGNKWELYAHLINVLSVMPADKNALTRTARALLQSRLDVWDNFMGWTSKERAQNADLQIAILRYFTRTNDRNAIPAIRKLLKTVNNEWIYDEGERVRDAARAALRAFGK